MKQLSFLSITFLIVILTTSGAAPFNTEAPKRSLLAIVASADDKVDFYSVDNMDRIARIPVGEKPLGIAVTSKGDSIFVTNKHDNTMTKINTKTFEIEDIIPAGEHPGKIVLTPDDRFAYVFDVLKGDISCIDLTLKKVVAIIASEREPSDIIMAPSGKQVFVTSYATDNLSIINTKTNEVVKTLHVGHSPAAMAITPDEKYLYIVNDVDSTITIVDVANETVEKNFKVGFFPQNIALSKDGRFIYVFCAPYDLSGDPNKIEVFERASSGKGTKNKKQKSGKTVSDLKHNVYPLRHTIKVGEAFNALTVSEKYLYALSKNDNSLYIINLAKNTLEKTVPTGNEPTSLVLTR